MTTPVEIGLPVRATSDSTIDVANDAVRDLPYGRVLKMKLDGKEIEIRSPDGSLELKISMTPNGPVVRLEGATLELTSLRDVSIDCQKFQVNAEKDVQVYTDDRLILLGREAHLRTSDNIFLNAAQIQQQGP